MKKRIFLGLVVSVTVLFFAVLSGGAAGPANSSNDNAPRLAPLSPKFLKHMERIKNGLPPPPPGQYAQYTQYTVNGASPPPTDLSHVGGVIDERVNRDYPPYYDLRNENRINPLVKTQQGYSCWMHAVMNSLESYLMPHEVRNFDAEYLDKYWNHGFSQPLGGDYRQATACLVRWDGPMEDPAEPYNLWRVGKNESIQKHVQQVMYLPKRSGPLDNNTVKWFIMTYGAVYTSLRFDSIYHNYQTDSYYCDKEEAINHGFAILGWDDTYHRSNFSRTPPGDGAFIGRMAWGANFGDRGCFYVSYYDKVLDVNASFNNAEDVDNYGTIYQYDPLGAIVPIGRGGNTYWGANIFTAVNDLPLEAVSFYAMDANVTYDIYIYKNLGLNGPLDGTPAASKTGGLIYPGYYTVKLDTPVPLTGGERFAVVIRLTDPNYRFPLAIEKPLENYSHKASANPGESFISQDGLEWADLNDSQPDSNVCIKAFSAAPLIPKPVISCRAREEILSMWLISRPYVVVSFTVENLNDVPELYYLKIYRRVNNGAFEVRDSRGRAELQSGSYTLIDRDIPGSGEYTYHVTAYDAIGFIIGRSPVQRINQ